MTEPPVKDVVAAIWALHDKYERWPALNDVEAQLPDPTFYRAFVDVWSNSETNNRHLELIDHLIRKRQTQAERVMPHLDREDRILAAGWRQPSFTATVTHLLLALDISGDAA